MYTSSDKNKDNRLFTQKRREKWLEENGPCKICGSFDNLEIDHIDPKTKSLQIRWGLSWTRLLKELAKCQVLCKDCHRKKTNNDLKTSLKKPIIHGTHTRYTRGCRCSDCKEAHRTYCRDFYRSRAIRNLAK